MSQTKKMCTVCGKKPTMSKYKNAKYCAECKVLMRKQRKKELYQKKLDPVPKKDKEEEIDKKDNGLDPKWLVRGNISVSGFSTSFNL